MREPSPHAEAVPRCRNCGAATGGAYCAACGQETRLAVPTLREFAREAGGRYVALDGVLWRTLGALLLRPGFLTREYLAGRRGRYVRPFRLYLAASLVCFLVVGIAAQRVVVVESIVTPAADAGAARATRSVPARAEAHRAADNAAVQAAVDDVIVELPGPLKPVEGVLRARMKSFLALSGEQRVRQVLAGMRQYAPYAMFALVPAFALLLKLAYAPRGGPPQRPHRYGEHLVFAVHSHAFTFLAIAAITLAPAPLRWLLWAAMPVYWVVALRSAYGGRWRGILVRGGLLAAAYLPLIGVAVGLLVLAAVLLG